MDEEILVNENISLKQALKILNSTGKRILLVVDPGKKLLGTLSDGDIRRIILDGRDLNGPISSYYCGTPARVKKGQYSSDEVKEIIVGNRLELLPIVDDEERLVDYITWDMLFEEKYGEVFKHGTISIPVVIMAGGRGERMAPFTKILPKPLIPINEQPIIELIMNKFSDQGVEKFFVTLNYKSDMVISYFNGVEHGFDIEFIKEVSYMGTAASLKLLRDKIDGNFIVNNCDVMVKADFSEVLAMHVGKKAALTMLTSIKDYIIPYGVVESDEIGSVKSLKEKPEYTFNINTGVYVANKSVLEYIPDGEKFDMTDLISILLAKGEKVLFYPVKEDDYTDIGQWPEYKKVISHFERLL
ncbi:MAG: NTP transferase domain-containing protein [Candidatus Omnitrophica bacterium]|nr:NTP transferase domain-containing protein [Candidatus Omnitrophota bacterium]